MSRKILKGNKEGKYIPYKAVFQGLNGNDQFTLSLEPIPQGPESLLIKFKYFKAHKFPKVALN
jgi:hypothetical protein